MPRQIIFAFSDTHGMYRRLTIPADADILICAGDDIIFNTYPVIARNLIPGSIVLLENSGIEYDDIKFYNVPARPYPKKPVTIPVDVDFLITHGPAYSYLDRDTGDKNLYLAVVGARAGDGCATCPPSS